MRLLAHWCSSILDILLPRKKRIVRLDTLSTDSIPVTPTPFEAAGMEIITLTTYRNPDIAGLIQALKYDHDPRAAHILAEVLGEYLREDIAQRRLFSTLPHILIPMPLHRTRLNERGFNQIERILETLPDEFHSGSLARVNTTLLTRTRATKQQTRLSRKDRLINVRGAFSRTTTLPRAHFYLIDDVTTTGATLTEAAKALAAPEVTVLALAHA